MAIRRPPYVRARENREIGLLLGDDARRPGRVVEKGHLSEVVAFSERAEDHLAPVRRDDLDGHAASHENVEGIPGLALLDDRLAAAVRAKRGRTRERRPVFQRDPLEKRNLREELRDDHQAPPLAGEPERQVDGGERLPPADLPRRRVGKYAAGGESGGGRDGGG